MADSRVEEELPLILVLLKEFYRVFLLGVSVFFAYVLIANVHLFTLDDTVRNMILKVLYMSAALLVATIFTKSLNVLYWDSKRSRKNGRKIPSLLRQGVNTAIYLATTFFVLQKVFNVSIGGLLTATGALGVVIGLALKEIISDVFSGIILGLDRTIRIGDWVRIEMRPYDPKVGFIAEMNWRTVHLHTAENVLVIIPNNVLANNLVTNLSQPSEQKEFELVFTFDFDIPSERIIRVLNAALFQTKEILQEPAPKTRISRVNGTGVEYKVKYWIIPARTGPGKARNFVINNILFNINQAGLSLSYPKSDLFTAAMPARNLDIREDRTGLLRKIELFNMLSAMELGMLAASLIERRMSKDQFIVRLGESGTSMYILVEGLLSVFIIDSVNNTEIKVAQLKPGNYFGEMSLLSGEPRSASISAYCDSLLFEIPKESMERLLTGNPGIAEIVSRKIAETKLKNESTLANLNQAECQDTKDKLTHSILSRIKSFFNLF